MFELPDPLHPAIVHFPIVLIFLGTLVSIFAIFTRRGSLPQFTALILLLAAGSAQLAVKTGEDQGDLALKRGSDAKSLIQNHLEWGKKTRTVAMVAGGLALVAALFSRIPGFRRLLAIVTAVAALGASYCVIETADYGNGMVYHHGVGIQSSQTGGQ
jgi:uncharacterized membrane protein